MSLSEFRSKPLIGKIFVSKHCFCFVCFFHTSRVFHLRPHVFHQIRCFPPDPVLFTPSAFSTPREPAPRTPFPGTLALAETVMILPAALHKSLVRKRTFVTLFGTYELIKLVPSRKSKVKSQNPTFLLHGQ